MNNSTTEKQYILNMDNYPKTKEFDEDIISLMALNKIGYKNIEQKQQEFLKKYNSYYSSYNGHQRMMNYGKYEKEGVVTTQGNRKYASAAPVKLDKMIKILDMPLNDDQKVYLMHEVFKTPEDFFDRFKDLYPVFMNTDRMKKFVDVYIFVNDEKNSLTFDKCNYMDSIKSELELYPEALRVLYDFINSPCYTVSLFIQNEKISLHQFNRYIEVIKLLRPSLYQTVKKVKEEKTEEGIKQQKEKFAANSVVISEIIREIIECQKNGTDYDLLEFYKKVPFKYTKEKFIAELMDFTNKTMPNYANILVNYIYKHGMTTRTKIIPINYKAINDPNCFTIINNITFDKDLDLALIDYLKEHNYPVCQNTLRIARNKFALGELELNSDKKVVKSLVLEDQE